MFRKAVFLLLGKNEFSVSRNFENTAAGFDQLGIHPRFFLDGLCQTGSLGIVVSVIAVFDRKALNHNLPLSPGEEFLGHLSISLTSLQEMNKMVIIAGQGSRSKDLVYWGERFGHNKKLYL